MKTNVFTNKVLSVTVLSILLSLTCSLSIAATGKGSDGGASKPMFDRALSEELQGQREEIERQKKEFLDLKMKERILQDSSTMTQKIVSGEFKMELIELLEDQEFTRSIVTSPAKNLFMQMLKDDLIGDIKNTDYVISERCFDEARVEKFLSTKIGERRAPICVSPRKFYEDYYSKTPVYKVEGTPGEFKLVPFSNSTGPIVFPFWQIAGMFLHDHARQFGQVLDDNHGFAVKMAVAIYEYPRAFGFVQQSTLNEGNDDRYRNWSNSLFVSGNWKQQDILITVKVPSNSRCAQVSENNRSVLERGQRDYNDKNPSLEQTHSLDKIVNVYANGVYLICKCDVPIFWSEFGIEEAEVTVVYKPTGRVLKTFTAKGGVHSRSGIIYVRLNPYFIDGSNKL